MKNVAVIVAAGKGKRFGSFLPKQYLKINGLEIIAWAIKNFEISKLIDAIVVVVEKKYIEFVRKRIIEKNKFKKILAVIAGGKERYESVYNALQFLKRYNPANVLIHDGARPFFDRKLIKKIILNLEANSACIPVKKIDFTVKRVLNEYVVKTEDREFLRTAHTPQGFKFNKILKLYNKEKLSNLKPTDDAMIFEKKCIKVKIIEDDNLNIKVTTKQDLKLLKNMLRR